MDPVILASLVTESLKLASSLSAMALQHDALTPEQVQAAWDAQREQWNEDWAEWLALQAGAPA